MFLYKNLTILRKQLNYLELLMNYVELPVELLVALPELLKFHTFGSSLADIQHEAVNHQNEIKKMRIDSLLNLLYENATLSAQVPSGTLEDLA